MFFQRTILGMGLEFIYLRNFSVSLVFSAFCTSHLIIYNAHPHLSCDRTVFSEHILNLCGTETTEMFASDPSVSINTSRSKDTRKLQFVIKHIILIFEQTVFINKGLNFEITSELPQSEEYNWGCAG